MPPNPAEPPEITSGEFWTGPGASTFFASAAQLEALAGMIVAMLGGHAAVEAALGASWPAPTGQVAVAANVPHMLWLGTVAGMLQAAGGQIIATGQQFEISKMATPTPAEVAYNQSEHVALNMANFLGFLTPYIVANRQLYGAYWVRGVSNKAAYEAASAAGVQAIPPVPPPPPTAAPLTGGGASSPTEAAPEEALLSAAQGSPMEMLMGMLPMASQMASGGPFKSITELPQKAMEQFSSLSSQFGSLTSDAGGFSGGGDWVTGVPAAGGPVAASLAGGAGGVGGGGGIGGAGAVSAASALRSPVSWSSTVNASAPAATEGAAPASRIAEVRSSGGTVAASGMGSPGAMMGPMAHGAAQQGGANDDKRQTQTVTADAVLSGAADAFRTPDGVPTISGGGGNDFAAAKGGT